MSQKLGDQGKRNDLKELIAGAESIEDIIINNPDVYCRYRNGLRDAMALKAVDKTCFCPEVFWYSGPTGCGKTLSATTQWPDACVIRCRKGLKWFDEYEG